MQRLNIFAVTLIAILLCASAAYAQSERRLGVVVAYPSSVGFQWQAAEKFAIRIDGDYRQFNTEATSEFNFTRVLPGLQFVPASFEVTTATRSRNIELGFSVLFDLHRSDDLRVYVAPRAGINFGYSSFETRFEGDPANLAAVTLPADSDSSSQSPFAGVGLGASHDISARLRVFGEAGFSYSRGEFSGAVGADLENNSVGLRGGVGMVILF